MNSQTFIVSNFEVDVSAHQSICLKVTPIQRCAKVDKEPLQRVIVMDENGRYASLHAPDPMIDDMMKAADLTDFKAMVLLSGCERVHIEANYTLKALAGDNTANFKFQTTAATICGFQKNEDGPIVHPLDCQKPPWNIEVIKIREVEHDIIEVKNKTGGHDRVPRRVVSSQDTPSRKYMEYRPKASFDKDGHEIKSKAGDVVAMCGFEYNPSYGSFDGKKHSVMLTSAIGERMRVLWEAVKKGEAPTLSSKTIEKAPLPNDAQTMSLEDMEAATKKTKLE